MTRIVSSSAGMRLPEAFEFEILRSSFVDLGHVPGAIVRPVDNNFGVFIKVEQMFMDLSVDWFSTFTVCITGIARALPGVRSLVVRYREFPGNPVTINSSVNHDYILRERDGEMDEFGQSIVACPLLAELPVGHDEAGPRELVRAEEARFLLRSNLGYQLEASAGDISVLYDRIEAFKTGVVV